MVQRQAESTILWRLSGLGPHQRFTETRICILTKSPGYFHSHWSLRSRSLKNSYPCMLGDSKRIVSTVFIIEFSSVQSLSLVQLFATPWTTARQASLSITNSRSPPKPMSSELVMPSDHLILSSPSPALNPSQRYKQSQLNETNTLWYRGKK